MGTNNNKPHLDFGMGALALNKRDDRAIPDKIATQKQRVEVNDQKKKNKE